MSKTHMSHEHVHTLQQIFQHPASHNLQWHDVLALVRHSGTVQEEGNGHLLLTLSGMSQTFNRSHNKDVCDVQQALDIRSFMEKAGVHKDGSIASSSTSADEGDPDEKGQHSHDHGHVNADQNRHAEQQLKTQEHEQNDRSNFQGGNAQSHQQGNRQK